MNRVLRTTIAMMTTATTAWAQGRGGPCTLGTELSYGISAIDCLQCTVRSDGNDHWTEYGAEPVVRAVMRTMNPIQQGDILVAIDGKPITTAAGGRALSHPEAGRAARFMVRRSGRTIELNVMPGTPCPVASAATAAALAAPARADTVSAAAKDSLRRRVVDEMARLRDTLELRYERDAFGRPYHFTFANGDSVNFNIPGPGRMAFEPNGRLLFITDSAGYQRFIDANGGRVPPRPFHWEFATSNLGFFEPIKPGPLSLTNGSSLIGFQIGSFGFNSQPTYHSTTPDGQSRASGNVQTDSADSKHDEMDRWTTRGWLGIGLSCERCGVDGLDRSRKDHAVRFTTFPYIVAVDPVAGAVAGFKVGDVIKSIDGESMLSERGMERFSTLRAGEWIRFLVERHGTLVSLKLKVPPRPE